MDFLLGYLMFQNLCLYNLRWYNVLDKKLNKVINWGSDF